MIIQIRDEDGTLHTTTRGKLNTCVGHMKRKYGPIKVNDECVDQMVNAGHLRVAERWGGIIDMPITTGGNTNSGAQRDRKQSAGA